MLVLAFSIPVIFIDEILKAVGRSMSNKELKLRMTNGYTNGNAKKVQ
jgi:hypothetical protein